MIHHPQIWHSRSYNRQIEMGFRCRVDRAYAGVLACRRLEKVVELLSKLGNEFESGVLVCR